MHLLMISGDRSVLEGKRGAFWYTLEELSKHWERIDVITPVVRSQKPEARDQGSETRSQKPETSLPTEALAKVGTQDADSFSNVFFHPCPYGLWYQPFWIQKKGKELAKIRQYTVMTVHDYPPFYNGIGAMLLHRATRIPIALEIHHIVGFPVPASSFERVGFLLSRIFLPFESRFVNAIRTVNRTVRSTLERWSIDPRKIHVVPSFYLDADTLKTSDVAKKEFDMVFCGRIVKNKGLQDVFLVLSALSSTTLLVIGDGPDKKRSEEEARRLGVLDRVTFAGWLPNQTDVMNAVQRGKILVVPSKSEGGPRIALEAMACGMPVISTPVGVMPEVIQNGQNGILTDGSVRSLIAAAREVLSDSTLQDTLGRNARSILDHFERKKLVANYADFLKRTGS